MVVSALFVFGVFNTSSGAANLIGAEVGLLHGSGEIDIHNQIVRHIHDIGNKTKEITTILEAEGDITDENTIESLAKAGEDLQAKLKDLTAIFDGNSFGKDKQILKDTFASDYKPAALELSYMLIRLKGEPEEKTETTPEEIAPVENIDETKLIGPVTTAKSVFVGKATPLVLAPITADKKTEITNSCAKLIEAHNKFSDILNQKRRY
jgi:hypothetical protein